MDIAIFGAGGLGREALTILRDLEAAGRPLGRFRGFLDDTVPDPGLLRRIEAVYLGSPENYQGDPDLRVVLAIGSGRVRRKLDERLAGLGLELVTLIHPSALVGADVEMGAGCLVAAGAQITTNVRMGRSTVVDRGTQVGHDCRIGAYVTLTPGVLISGTVSIGDGATVFTGATVIPSVELEEGSVVGAGAVVIRDVAAGSIVAGVPARPIS